MKFIDINIIKLSIYMNILLVSDKNIISSKFCHTSAN